MQRIKLTAKDIPAIFRAAFPAYKGRKWTAQVGTKVYISDTNWSGGTKNTYRAVDLMTGLVTDPSPRALGPWYSPNEPTLEIPPHVVVLEHSIFMGKDSGITVHVRPDDIAHALPASPVGGKRRHAGGGGISAKQFAAAMRARKLGGLR